MKPRVVVIGGGISGLAAAHRLVELSREKNLPLEVKLLEASNRLGGVISTTRKDAFLMEGGPDCFLSEKPWALELVRRLGLENELIGTREACRKSFVVRAGKLLVVPDGFYLTAPVRIRPFLASSLFSWPGKIRMAFDYFLPARRDGEDESVAHFIRRRFGAEALARVGEAMVAGIYSSDSEKLSLRSTFPQFLEMEQKYGSVIRGLKKRGQKSASGPRYSLFLSLRGGIQTLADALAKRLTQDSVIFDAPVRSLRKESKWMIRFGPDRELEADHVILAVAAPKSAEMLRSFDGELTRQLQAIEFTSVATVNFAYRRNQIRHALDGFGFVAPRREHVSMIGCSFSSVKFPDRSPEDCVLLRAFISEDQPESAVKRDLECLLGIEGDPLFVSRDRHPEAMPQYHVGHLDRVARIEELTRRHEGLYLIGNSFRGIGIPDCVHSAEEAAERMIQDLKH